MILIRDAGEACVRQAVDIQFRIDGRPRSIEPGGNLIVDAMTGAQVPRVR